MVFQRAAFEAAVIASQTGAVLTYVHVVDTSFLKEVLADPLSRSFEEEMMVGIGMHILRSAERIAKATGVLPDMYLKKGPVLEGILAVAEELHADLLILSESRDSIIKKSLLRADDGPALKEPALSTGRRRKRATQLHAQYNREEENE
jgi:nucleotide-binding universal stress UspA family protein